MEACLAHPSGSAAESAMVVGDAPAESSRLDFGKMDYGCEHYRRRCKIRAPCCNEVFVCRHCHNESLVDRHELRRQDIQKVICLVCDTEQPPAQVCTNCGVNMGEYFCNICKFYDDDTNKKQYHCKDCGICRVGGRENFFHCQKCGACYSIELRDKHICVENSMRHYCSICYEFLFDSLKETRVLKCGHTIHADCLDEMLGHQRYACPICSKSVIDMSRMWRKLDEEQAELVQVRASSSASSSRGTTDDTLRVSLEGAVARAERAEQALEERVEELRVLRQQAGQHARHLDEVMTRAAQAEGERELFRGQLALYEHKLAAREVRLVARDLRIRSLEEVTSLQLRPAADREEVFRLRG